MLGILILGIVQGIAEFLPISSSAHLIILRDLFGIGSTITEEIALVFDVSLHFGTLLAVGVFFFKDFINMIAKGVTKPKTKDGKLLWHIIIATIPAGIAGVLFESAVEEYARTNFYLIAGALIVMGVIIYLCDKKAKATKEIKDMNWIDALIIGFSQIFALIPGFSRSGTTIATARLRNIDRESAAKFSFYLSAPVILGAVGVSLLKDNNLTLILDNPLIFIIGILTAFIIGMLCITFLLQYIKKHDFKIFMIYRIIFAIAIITYMFIK